MSHCPNCGDRVEETHHYCASCGHPLSRTAGAEDDPWYGDREGFLSYRSLSYLNELLEGERTPDRDSVAYRRLQREVIAALGDFARLAAVDGLNFLWLGVKGMSDIELRRPIEEMDRQEFQQYLGTVGLHRTLRLYDDGFGADFENEFDDRLQEAIEITEQELDEGSKS